MIVDPTEKFSFENTVFEPFFLFVMRYLFFVLLAELAWKCSIIAGKFYDIQGLNTWSWTYIGLFIGSFTFSLIALLTLKILKSNKLATIGKKFLFSTKENFRNQRRNFAMIVTIFLFIEFLIYEINSVGLDEPTLWSLCLTYLKSISLTLFIFIFWENKLRERIECYYFYRGIVLC